MVQVLGCSGKLWRCAKAEVEKIQTVNKRLPLQNITAPCYGLGYPAIELHLGMPPFGKKIFVCLEKNHDLYLQEIFFFFFNNKSTEEPDISPVVYLTLPLQFFIAGCAGNKRLSYTRSLNVLREGCDLLSGNNKYTWTHERQFQRKHV